MKPFCATSNKCTAYLGKEEYRTSRIVFLDLSWNTMDFFLYLDCGSNYSHLPMFYQDNSVTMTMRRSLVHTNGKICPHDYTFNCLALALFLWGHSFAHFWHVKLLLVVDLRPMYFRPCAVTKHSSNIRKITTKLWLQNITVQYHHLKIEL